MRKPTGRWIAVGVLALVAALARAGETAGDKGESAEAKKLRGRATAPKPGEIDAGATLEALLGKSDRAAFSEAKGASIDGWVVQAEQEEDGDFHLAMAATKGETDTRKWLIVEVTPAWQKKAASLSPASLRKSVGTKLHVTGWLYFEPDEEQPDPRGSRWEIHPVTAVAPSK